MYIRKLRVQNVKRLRDFELDFTNADGKPRMWTVLIGDNGTAKTTILQAIGLLAAGNKAADQLGEPVIPHLRDRRSDLAAEMEAVFELPDEAYVGGPSDVQLPPSAATSPRQLESQLRLDRGSTGFRGRSRQTGYSFNNDERSQEYPFDLLTHARDQNEPYWFVAAYGIARLLPDSRMVPRLNRPSIDRMRSLFSPDFGLTGTAFASYFDTREVGDDTNQAAEKARRYHRVLKRALLDAEHLLPDVLDIELRGRGGVSTAGDLMERNKFRQRLTDSTSVMLPMTGLSHGYQSVIAWVADLVGHIVLEADLELEPADMLGLVLLDEIDLYIHPRWQVGMISALKEVFPRIQFVATTHSPLILAGLRPDRDEVVRLGFDEKSGDVIQINMKGPSGIEPDARVMTTARIFQDYFGLGRVFGAEEGVLLAEWQAIVSNPFRTKSADEKAKKLARKLKAMGVDLGVEPTRRQVT